MSASAGRVPALSHAHHGGCHCGNVRWTLTTRLGAAQLPVRACQCTFCRRHGALTSSDPAGTLGFAVQDPVALLRYRFATGTAEFLLCARCGVYVGAVMKEDGRRFGIVNLNSLDARADLTPVPEAMDYSAEDATARRLRRRVRWTPMVDDEGSG